MRHVMSVDPFAQESGLRALDTRFATCYIHLQEEGYIPPVIVLQSVFLPSVITQELEFLISCIKLLPGRVVYFL